MVIQGLNRLNVVKRMLLLSAIATVGLLDLAFTTYLSHEDLFDSPQNIVGKANASGAPRPFQPQLGQSNVDVNNLATDLYDYDNDRSATPIRSSHTSRSRKMAAPVAIKFVRPATPCRTVSYPFVGEQYVVQVTDETSCMTLTAGKFKRDNLMAQVIPRHSR